MKKFWLQIVSSRLAITLALVALVSTQLVVLFGFMPGRWHWSGISPDSVQYICYALSLPWVAPFVDPTLAEAAIDAFGPEGFQGTQCENVEIINTVFSRLVTPALIGIAALSGFEVALVIPSILVYVFFAILWFLLMAPPSRPIDAFTWLWVLVPLATPALATQLPLVLTEGPLTLAYVVGVVAVLGGFPISNRMRFLVVLGAGFLMLLSRQSWPLVAFLWAGLCFVEPVRSWLSGLSRFGRFGISASWLIAAVMLPLLAQSVINQLTERPGTTTDYYSDMGTLLDGQAILIAASRSLTDDVMSSIGRADLITLAALLWALAILLTLIQGQRFLAMFVIAPAWLLGVYQTGIVVVEVGDSGIGTNFRYFVPVFFATLSAYAVSYRASGMQHVPILIGRKESGSTST